MTANKPSRRSKRFPQLSKSIRKARKYAGVSEAIQRFSKLDHEEMMRKQRFVAAHD